MKRLITQSQLWLIEIDLNDLVSRSPGIAFLLEIRMQQFFSRNKNALKILHSGVHQIQKKYIVHDEAGSPVYAETEEGKEKKWKFLESTLGNSGQLLTGKELDEVYNEEVREFLNRSVNVEI